MAILRSGRRVEEKPPPPILTVNAPHRFPWRFSPLQAQDMLNLIQLLAICMTWEIIQETHIEVTQSQNSTGVGSSGGAQLTLTPLWIHVVAALAAVLLKGLIVHNIIMQREPQKYFAYVYCPMYVFMPLLTYTVTSSIWKGMLTVVFPDTNSVWIISFIAQRALEHSITGKLTGAMKTGYWEGYEICFLATECGVVFFSNMIRHTCFLCWVCGFCGGILRLLHLYWKGDGKSSAPENKLGWHEICLRHYLHGFRLQLVGNSASDTKDVSKMRQLTHLVACSCASFCVG